MKHIVIFIFLLISNTQLRGQDLFSFISFDGTEIAYVDEGNGEIVLLLHGFISNGSSWYGTDLKKKLLAKGFRVIIPDMRGNGQSGKPQTESAYSDDAEIKDLMKLMDHIGVESYTGVGYSRGSIVLAKLLTVETRIIQAVIGGMGIDFTNPKWDRRIMFMNAFLGLEDLNEDTEGAVNYAKSIDADLRVLGWLQKYQPVTPRKVLEKIKTPVLVIAGDEDVDNGKPKKLHRCLKNSTLKIVPGDHNTTYRGEDFANGVMDYLLYGE